MKKKYIFNKRPSKVITLMNPAMIILLLIMVFTVTLNANPLLNVNSEERSVYDLFKGSLVSEQFNTTMGTISIYKSVVMANEHEKISLNLNAADDAGLYLKPLNSISVSYLHASGSSSFIEGSSGGKLEKGANFSLYQDAYLSLGESLVVYCQLDEKFNSKDREVNVFRTYAKLFFWKFSLEGGIDNINLGPGEYGLLLSNNTVPYPMLKLQTEDHLEIYGKWDLLILNGWLREQRTDASNPLILAIRLAWKPFNFIELGGTRTTLYGGEGRPLYKLWEYPKMIIGTEENIPGSKYDNDAYCGYDISLYLPVHRYIRAVKVSKLYFQHAATDIKAPWQKEDSGWGIKFYSPAYQAGLLLTTDNNTFRFEFAQTDSDFYIHHNYSTEGLSYKGMCMGYPYGRNTRSFLIKHRYYFTEKFSIEYSGGFYTQKSPDTPDSSMKRFFGSVLADIKISRFIIQGYFRYEGTRGYNSSEDPVQINITDENKGFFTSGISVSCRL